LADLVLWTAGLGDHRRLGLWIGRVDVTSKVRKIDWGFHLKRFCDSAGRNLDVTDLFAVVSVVALEAPATRVASAGQISELLYAALGLIQIGGFAVCRGLRVLPVRFGGASGLVRVACHRSSGFCSA
jgi:hypothetical protein